MPHSSASEPDEASFGQSPVFILTASRSGSTLMRFILDSHPDMACGPEINIASLCAQLVVDWATLETAASSGQPGSAPLSPEAGLAIRGVFDQMFGNYLRLRGKKRWCDKSLGTVGFAELMLRLYPGARFICLFRHCMDVIASGIEATPWGLHGHGFSRYVMKYPGNDVAAIGNYWLDSVQSSLAFEAAYPDVCHRVRYEDLVTDPEAVIAGIFSFLGASQVPGISELVFRTAHEKGGPADAKIWFTSAITSGSVGRGHAVPADMLPGQLRDKINEALARLEYRPADETWSAASGPVDPRLQASPSRPAAPAPAPAAGPGQQAAASALAARIESCDDGTRRAISAQWPDLDGTEIRFVVQPAAGPGDELRAALGLGGPSVPAASPAAGDAGQRPEVVITADPATWLGLLEGRANLMTEVRASRVRYRGPGEGRAVRPDGLHAAAALLGMATIPTVRISTQSPAPAAVAAT